MRAYILLKVNPNDTTELMRLLRGVSGIQQANLIHGPYDCLLEVHTKSLEGINEVVSTVRALKGVTDTMTCLVVQSWQN